MQPSDEALMLRYKDGDAAAFESLYRRHKGALYRYTLRSCDSHAIAEELFQDIWSGVIAARSRYTDSAKFTTWLYHIAHNRLVDHYRANGKWDEFLVEDEVAEDCAVAAPHSQPEKQSELNRQIKRLLECIEQLPAPQKQVFLLKEEAGLALEAIAGMVKESREAIKSRMRYAIGKLRNCMGDEL